jgi:hypothetical protein
VPSELFATVNRYVPGVKPEGNNATICVGVSDTRGNTLVLINTVGSFFPLGPRKLMPPIVMRVMVESTLALVMTIFLISPLSD